MIFCEKSLPRTSDLHWMKTRKKKQKQKKKKSWTQSAPGGGGGDFLYIFAKNYAETLIYKGIELWKK